MVFEEGKIDIGQNDEDQDDAASNDQNKVTQVVGHEIHFFFDEDGTVTITDLPDELANIPSKLEMGK
ncbi:MAG: hypothetical protein ACTSU9_00570 [Promethearchaeota archaeon]